MKVKFCGAAREVTGSSHLVTLDDGTRILLDCGLYQGRDKDMEHSNRRWLYKPEEIDCVILSHAHIDHSGKLPRLFRDGYRGPVRCTHATRSLCAIMLLDSAYIQERDAEWENRKRREKKKKGKPVEPLYVSEDVKLTMNHFISYGYDKWYRIHEKVEVMFRDAGHILGSAAVALRIRENGEEKILGFTGDVGRPDRPILRDPQPLPPVDYLICESTYGDRDHISRPDESERLLSIIENTCLEKKGKLIIPAFSVGRTQEIVHMLDQLETAGRLPHLDVFVDSPLAVNATVVFGAHPECYDTDLNAYLLTDDNPFGFNTLIYARDVEISKQLNTRRKPCIIISASGMMTAGRIRHHMYNNIDKRKNTFLMVGYCSPETPGGQLKNGARSLRIFGEEKFVNAEIEVMDSFSAHGDRREIVSYIENQKSSLKKLFLVHGEYDSQVAFRHFLTLHNFSDIEIPSLGAEYQL